MRAVVPRGPTPYPLPVPSAAATRPSARPGPTVWDV